MFVEPRCATASPAVPLPVTLPMSSAVFTGVVTAVRIALSCTAFTSTFIA